MLYKRTKIFFVTALFIGSSFVSPVLTASFAETCKSAAKNTAKGVASTVFGLASIHTLCRLQEICNRRYLEDRLINWYAKPFFGNQLQKHLGLDYIEAAEMTSPLISFAAYAVTISGVIGLYNYWKNSKDEGKTNQTTTEETKEEQKEEENQNNSKDEDKTNQTTTEETKEEQKEKENQNNNKNEDNTDQTPNNTPEKPDTETENVENR